MDVNDKNNVIPMVSPTNKIGESKKKIIHRLNNLEGQQKVVSDFSQMFSRQMMSNFSKLDSDVSGIVAEIQELKYRLLAVIECLKLNEEDLDKSVDCKKLAHFEQESAREDEVHKLIPSDKVDESSIVIFTTKELDNPKKGILRSKIDLADPRVKTILAPLIGKTIGDIVVIEMAGVKHNLEILGIRKRSN